MNNPQIFEADKTYKVTYADNKGGTQEIEFTPSEDLSKAKVISQLRDEHKDYLKLIKITEGYNKKEENTNMEFKTYKDLVKAGRAADVCDNVFDTCVYIDYEIGSSDYYDMCLDLICAELDILDADMDYSLVKCNVTDFVKKHLNAFDEVFEINAEDEETKIAEIVCDMFDSVVSGWASEKAYERLYYALLDDKDNKVEKVEEEKPTTRKALTELNVSTFADLKEAIENLYEEELIDDDQYDEFNDIIFDRESKCEKYINDRSEVTNTDERDMIGIEADYVTGAIKDIIETLPEEVIEEAKVEEAKKDIGELVLTLKQMAYEILQSDEMGFPEDEAKEFTVVELKNGEDNDIIVEVRAELDYDGMMNLVDYLNPVVKGYDKESYFDMVEPGIAQAVITGYTLPVVEETVNPVEDPMEVIVENLVEEIVEEAKIEEVKASLSKERKAEIIAELFDWIDYHELDALDILNITEEDLHKSSHLELDDSKMDEIIDEGIACVIDHVNGDEEEKIAFKDVIGLNDEECNILGLEWEEVEPEYQADVELDMKNTQEFLNESIKDTDFIVYRSTVEGPLYLTGLSTSFRKEDAVKYPTEEEAKEALHDYIQNVVDPDADDFKVARLNESKGEVDLSLNLKEWYKEAYPDDDIYEEIIDTVTFQDVQDALNKGDNVYDVMGAHDSIVRERVFEKLSQLRNVDYDVVYNEWLDSGEKFSDEEIEAFKTVFNNIMNKKTEAVEEPAADEGFEELEAMIPENVEEVKEAVEEVTSEIENPTTEEVLATDVVNDTMDVLIVDEDAAINGYREFLNQAKATLLPPLYNVLEKEVMEIIKDEEDHVNKLEALKATFHLNNTTIEEVIEPQEEPVEEVSEEE